MTDEELGGQESENWISVYKPGLTQLVKDLTEARIRNATLTKGVDELNVLLKLLRRRNQDGYK